MIFLFSKGKYAFEYCYYALSLRTRAIVSYAPYAFEKY